MTTLPHSWIHGTRGKRPGNWWYLKPKHHACMRIQVLDENIEPEPDCTGVFKPWDWCRDVVAFDPDAPWRAWIPSFDPRPYSHGPVYSWLFPNHAASKWNVQGSLSSWAIHPSIIAHCELVPSLFHYASALATSCAWTGPLPPKNPDLTALGRHYRTLQDANNHLWTYRRAVLDVLSFIAYLLLQYYILRSKDWVSCKLLHNYPPSLRYFLKLHLFDGQKRFRGVILDMDRFYPFFHSNQDICRPFLELMDEWTPWPIPLAILHNYQGHDEHYNTIFDPERLKSCPASLPEGGVYVVARTGDRTGYVPTTPRVVAALEKSFHSIRCESEIDGYNARIFCLDQPITERYCENLIDPQNIQSFCFAQETFVQVIHLVSTSPSPPPTEARFSKRRRLGDASEKSLNASDDLLGGELSIPTQSTSSRKSGTLVNVSTTNGLIATEVSQSCKQRLDEISTSVSHLSSSDLNVRLGRAFKPSISWIKPEVSLLGRLGFPLDIASQHPLPSSLPNKDKLQQLLRGADFRCLPGTCSSWLAETALVPSSLGNSRSLLPLTADDIHLDFVNNLIVRLPYKSEMVLICYFEQFPDAKPAELLAVCIRFGMPVFISWPRDVGKRWASEYREDQGECAVTHQELVVTFIAPALTTAQACREWLTRIQRLCRRPEARGLLFYGGYVSRLMVEVMGTEHVRDVMKGPSHRFLAHGDRNMLKDEKEWDYRDSEMGGDFISDPMLTEMYGVTEDRTRSLWPPLEHFNEMDRWTGMWSDQNETWFRSVWDLIRDGRMSPQAWHTSRAGTSLQVGLFPQATAERKMAPFRKSARLFLEKWRSEGIRYLNGTPLAGAGEIRMKP
jgi:hypothetical protein